MSTVSAIFTDPRQIGRRNRPDYVFVEQFRDEHGRHAVMHRCCDFDRLADERAQLVHQGAVPAPNTKQPRAGTRGC